MSEKGARDVAIISTVLAGYLLIAGIAMWSDAATPAEAAVGRADAGRPGIDSYTGDASGSSGPAGPGGPAGS